MIEQRIKIIESRVERKTYTIRNYDFAVLVLITNGFSHWYCRAFYHEETLIIYLKFEFFHAKVEVHGILVYNSASLAFVL
jgi:hypothetical protein